MFNDNAFHDLTTASSGFGATRRRASSRTLPQFLHAGTTPNAPHAPVVFGFELAGRGPGTPWFGHGGIAGGRNFEYRHFPASGVTLIAYSNQNNGAYDELKKNAIRPITGER